MALGRRGPGSPAGRAGAPIGSRDRKRPDPARLNQCERGRDVDDTKRNVAGEHVGCDRSRALVGYECEFDSSRVIEQLRREMHRGPITAMADRKRVGPGFGAHDHLLERAGGRR